MATTIDAFRVSRGRLSYCILHYDPLFSFQ